MDGILVKELNFQSEIDISDLTSGVYLIKYGNQSGKFVKE
jgi:predicted NUDIX family NTP pyrophosphohydrolase